MVIDLGNGLETNARLNLPITGEGPFLGILLVPGSGPVDMNETGGHLRIDNKRVHSFIQMLDHSMILLNISQIGVLQYYNMIREQLEQISHF